MYVCMYIYIYILSYMYRERERPYDTVRDPNRAQISQFEPFELIVLFELDEQLQRLFETYLSIDA